MNKPNKTTKYLYRRNGMDPLEVYHEWEEKQIEESNDLDDDLDEKELFAFDENDYFAKIEPEEAKRRKKQWQKPIYRKNRKKHIKNTKTSK